MGALGGCKAKIGAACDSALKCSVRGERSCDLSAPGGYCTIEGCSHGSCPKEAACVKVYGSDFLTVACDPAREDIGNEPHDDCEPDQVCLPEGLCADEVWARTSCRRECNDDGDCRDGYRCASTGSDGIYGAPDPDHPTRVVNLQICVPVDF